MSKEHVAVLKKARQLIQNEKSFYICFAVQDAAELRKKKGSSIAAKAIRKGIHRDMGRGCATYSDWLFLYHYKFFNRYSHKPGRLAWIDALIEYWRNK